MVRKIGLALAGGAATLVAGLGGLYLVSPPKSLDVLNDLFPGDAGVSRVAAGARYRPGDAGLLDVWARPAAAAARRPVVVFFHGGGWVTGRRTEYGFAAKAYAARGYVVVVPDYRKVPGVRFPAFIEDGAGAVRWVRDHIARFGGDPDRIVLAGHSAGAYIAAMLALDPRYLRAAGVDAASIRAVIGLAGPYDFFPFTSPLAIAALGNAPDPRQTQPITFARGDAPPLWLATGSKDEQVNPHNAESLAARQRALGSRTTMLRVYPGRSHNDLVMALAKPFRRRIPVLDESVAFIEQHVR